MNTEARSGFNGSYHDRVGKIRAAAAIALKELDELRSRGPMTRETFDTEVGRIAREKLHPHGCDLVVHRFDDGITRFVIEVHSTGRRYDLIKSFFHRDDELTPETKSLTYALGLEKGRSNRSGKVPNHLKDSGIKGR